MRRKRKRKSRMIKHISIPPDVTLVVLDLDGTIYAKPRMSLHMMHRLRHDMPYLMAERRWRKAHRQALKTGSPIPPKPVPEQWYRQSYLPTMVQIIADYYHPQKWVQPLLDECRMRNIKVVVLSDYEAALDKLRVLGLDASAFDAVLATSDLGSIKPDPRLGDKLKDAISNAALDWRHVLFIGDRKDTDGLLAKALGAQFMHV